MVIIITVIVVDIITSINITMVNGTNMIVAIITLSFLLLCVCILDIYIILQLYSYVPWSKHANMSYGRPILKNPTNRIPG